jgi:uncharacterized membrane protein YoaT (DUF817 family)
MLEIKAAPDRAPADAGDEESRVDLVLARLMPGFERALGRAAPAPVVRGLSEFLVFGVKQAWACLFGGLMLAAIILTAAFWPQPAPFARYDFLFLYAIAVQLAFLAMRLERPAEASTILVFHIVGTLMELFKTAAGSWTYPEPAFFRIDGVPLFSGFMYACVGSYLARVSRTHAFTFDRYPRRRYSVLLAALIYLNFFTHHYLHDIRVLLFAGAAALFWRSQVSFRVWRWRHRMPLLLGFFLVSLFIWFAENIATLAGVWLYPDQHGAWKPVSLGKLGSWYLLMIISWVLVTLVHAPRIAPRAPAAGQ